MRTYKRLFLQSRSIYLTFLLIFVINYAVNFIGNLLMNGFSNQFSPTSITPMISLYLGIFLLVSSISMITSSFPMSLTMGATRRKSILDIYSYTLATSIIISLFINLMTMLSSHIIIGKSVIPYIMGHNWNVFNGFLYKSFTILLISLTISGLIMWIISGFKVAGVFNGLARILLTLTLIFSQLSKFVNFVIWGQNQYYIHIMLLVVITLTYILTYRSMLRYELK